MLFVCPKGMQGNVGALQFPFVEQSLDGPVSTEGRKQSGNLTQGSDCYRNSSRLAPNRYSTAGFVTVFYSTANWWFLDYLQILLPPGFTGQIAV